MNTNDGNSSLCCIASDSDDDDVGCYDKDSLWTVLEWANAGEIFDCVRRLDPASAKRFFRQIVVGVDYIHSCGFAHMDLSLENIMLHYPDGQRGTGKPQVKIIDFGMAVECATVSASSLCYRGKAQYMAPELLEHKRRTPSRHDDGNTADYLNPRQADMYSLGVILFILATAGTPPYNKPFDMAFMHMWRGKKGIEFLLKSWQKPLDPEVIDLVSKLICPVSRRFTMAGVLAHPYLQVKAEQTAVEERISGLLSTGRQST